MLSQQSILFNVHLLSIYCMEYLLSYNFYKIKLMINKMVKLHDVSLLRIHIPEFIFKKIHKGENQN